MLAKPPSHRSSFSRLAHTQANHRASEVKILQLCSPFLPPLKEQVNNFNFPSCHFYSRLDAVATADELPSAVTKKRTSTCGLVLLLRGRSG